MCTVLIWRSQIIGSLAFGETFGGVASGKHDCQISVSTMLNLGSTGVEHPWIATVMKSLTKGALGDCSKRFPIVAKIAMWILAGPVNKLIEQTRAHEINSRQLVKR